MKLKLTGSQILSLTIVILTFAAALFVYPQMPEKIASHWDINGSVNGYMDRFWGTFLLPIISAFMYILMMFIPMMDPKKENIKKFRAYFDNFIAILLTFFFWLYAMTIIWSLGYKFNFNQWIIPPFSALFFYIGILIEHAEPNWTIGIRTPWTLESKTVWIKTHLLGSKLFKISAIIGLLGISTPQYSFWFIIIPVILSALFTMFYSYWIFTKEKKK
jgi:uncharacterized membrane protein